MAMPLGGVRLAVLPGVVPQAQRKRPGTARQITSAPERPVRTQAIGKRQPEPPAPTPARAPWLGTVVQVVGFVATVLGIVGSAFALNMSLRGFISDSITVFKSEQATSITVLKADLTASNREQAASNRELATSITVLKADLTASNREQAASNRELAASITVLKSELAASNREQAASNRELTTKLDATNASIKELKSEVNVKLDNFSASVQTQQIETAKLQGLVSGLQEGVEKK